MSQPSVAFGKMKKAINNFHYRNIVRLAKVLTVAQGLQLRLHGEENIPQDSGAVVVVNHTGYMDFVLGGYLPYLRKRLVRYMAKSEVFDKPVVGTLMRIMGHIPVDRVDGSASLRTAVEKAREGELVGIFAEGTISRSFEIRSMRSGAVRIAHEAGVPIVPEVMFGSQRLWTKGHKMNLGRSKTPILIEALEPYYTTGDPAHDIEEIRKRMQQSLEKLWQRYIDEFGPMPQGEFWVPARLGGGAPTLEETETQDRAVESERYRVRRLRDDLTTLKDKVRELSTELTEATIAKVSLPGHKDKAESTEQQATPKHTAGETVAWVKENLNAVVEEAARGAGDGRDRIAEVMEQLKRDVRDAQASLSMGGKEIYAGSRMEQVLVSAAAQSRIIMSRLPHRIKADFGKVPKVVVADEAAFNHENGGLSQRLIAAFAELNEDLNSVIVLSVGAGESDFQEIPQDLWRVEYNGAVISHSGAPVEQHFLSTDLVADIDYAICAHEGITVTWNRVSDWESGAARTASGEVNAGPGQIKEILGAELADQIEIVQSDHGAVITAAGVSRANAVFSVLELIDPSLNKPLLLEGKHETSEAKNNEVLAFLSQYGDEGLLDLNSVALESAPVSVLKHAKSVTYSSDKEGTAEVLDIVARQRDAQNKK